MTGVHIPPGKRGIRLSDKPTISVVVASFRERRLLKACLDSLADQCRERDAAIIVARASSPSDTAALRAEYPGVQFVDAPPSSSIPALRAIGMAAAGGDIVALTEDHCIVSPDWIAQLVSACGRRSDVVGGSVGNAQCQRAVDWAAYFSEYGFFAEGAVNSAATPLLTGANVAYSRRVVGDVIELARRGEWENAVHARLSGAGSSLEFLKTAAVYQNHNYRVGEFCRDRYTHGYDYARRRLVDEAKGRRWLLLTGSVALPILLMLRIARAAAPSRMFTFLRALPVTLVFLSAWSLGEAVGYWRGPAPEATRAD